MADDVENMTHMTVTATCGHPVTFRVRPDKPMVNRIGKHEHRKCGPCRILDEQARQAAGFTDKVTIKKGQESKHLPPGTTITLHQVNSDKIWTGVLTADDLSVTATSTGLMGLMSKLAKQWLSQKGYKVKK